MQHVAQWPPFCFISAICCLRPHLYENEKIDLIYLPPSRHSESEIEHGLYKGIAIFFQYSAVLRGWIMKEKMCSFVAVITFVFIFSDEGHRKRQTNNNVWSPLREYWHTE